MAIISKGKVLAQGTPDEFIQELQGKVWTKTVAKTELKNYRHLDLISSQLYAGKVKLHIQADQPLESGFEPVAADLEDVYFCALNQSNLKPELV